MISSITGTKSGSSFIFCADTTIANFKHQVFNQASLFFQKHKNTNWKTNQQQPQFYDNYETHQINIYTSPNLMKDNNFNLKGILPIKILAKPCN